MLCTRIKPALRQLTRHPAFSLINLTGLSIGIAASFLILLYAARELRCDRQYPDADRIARVGTDFFHMGGFAMSQEMLAPLMAGTAKDVQDVTAFEKAFDAPDLRTSTQERAYKDINPYFIDGAFFRIFPFPVIAGSIPSGGLATGQAILTEATAQRLFGSASAVGRTIYLGKDNAPSTIVAVIGSSLSQTHLAPSLLLPRMTRASSTPTDAWTSASVYTYVKLRPQGSFKGLSRWLEQLEERVIYPASASSALYSQWKDSEIAVSFIIQPLPDIYFHSSLKFELSPGGSLTLVKILGAIGIFLLLLAIINYINLVTARSALRSREMGLRKTFGASHRSILRQLVGESLLFSLLSLLPAIALIRLISFIYQAQTGAPLLGDRPWPLQYYLGLLGLTLLTGLVAGIYPALQMAALKPLSALRVAVSGPTAGRYGKGSLSIRNALVTLQFTIATGLVFASLVVYAQINYMKNRDLGFRTDGVVLIENADKLGEKAPAFQTLLERLPEVKSSSFCYRIPGGASFSMGTYRSPDLSRNLSLETFSVDAGYIPTLRLRLLNGRNFDRTRISDTNALILNESAVAALGLFEPIGATINGAEKVIGVVKDFNYGSLKEKIGPVVLRYSPQGRSLAIRIAGTGTSAFIGRLQDLARSYPGGEALRIGFLDDNFAHMAAREKMFGRAISFFTILAILLALLGLTGLTLFTIQRRLKELGVRKVLGAGRRDVLALISRDLVRLALLAAFIALPLSSCIIHSWLGQFAYHTTIGPAFYFYTTGLVLTLALSVTTLLTLKTAMVSPVKTLRPE